MTKEQLVMARVRTENGSVSVCADEQLSMQVQEQMLKEDWPLSTGVEVRVAMSTNGVVNTQPATDAQDICLEANLEIMAQNKDIMCKIPQKTKFRFIKRVMNRLLRLTNRYQQMFNQAVHEAVSALVGTVRWLKPALRMTDEKANQALSCCDALEERMLQVERRLAQETSQNRELQEEVHLLRERLQEAEQQAESHAQDAIRHTETLAQNVMQQIQEINLQNHKEQRHREEQDSIVSAAARDLMRAKWQVRDMIAERRDERDRQLRCGICGHSAPLHTFETKETDCIFAGGHLKRFVCPDCGCIFGPTKFADQSKQEFDDDYIVHYAGFSEGDSTHKEKFAFEKLNPTKDGIYLNYGCGKWSHTIEELRAQGYQVYGYEPYVADIDNPYIITDKNELLKMRFDGIFSNDLLEHLPDPIGELQFMKLLLRTAESKMSHCTGCFLYKYEYTRFHMFFFTGNSVHVLAEKAGLSILEQDNEPELGDPCYVFGVQDSRFDLLSRMKSTDKNQLDTGLKAGNNEFLFGLYLTLVPGEYVFTACLTLADNTDRIHCDITSEHGKNVLQSLTLYSGYNHIRLVLDEVQTDLELVMKNTARQGDIVLERLTLVPKAIDSK